MMKITLIAIGVILCLILPIFFVFESLASEKVQYKLPCKDGDGNEMLDGSMCLKEVVVYRGMTLESSLFFRDTFFYVGTIALPCGFLLLFYSSCLEEARK